MGYFINAETGYYEGDRISPCDQEVPRRPDGAHLWDEGQWLPSPALVAAAQSAQTQAAIERLAGQGNDASLARGLEDLIGLLLAKGALAQSDLPPPLLAKINNRRAVRGQDAL